MKSAKDNPYYNIFIIFICGVICWIASINSIKIGNGVDTLTYIYFPLIITLILITIYLISRLFTKQKNWVITIIGGLFLLFLGAKTYYDFIYN